MFKKFIASTLFLIVIFTLFSFFVYPGQHVMEWDQLIYFPLGQKHVDQSLFTRDLLLQYPESSFTVFDDFLGFLLRLRVDIFILLMILNLVLRFLFYYFLYKLIKYFVKDKLFSFLTLMMFLTPFTIFWAIETYPTELLPRLITSVLGLYYLWLSLNNKSFILQSLLLSVSILIHPLNSLIFVLHFLFSPLISKKTLKIYFKREYFIGYLFFALVAIAFLLLANSPEVINLKPLDNQWFMPICQNTNFMFMTFCDINSFAYYTFFFFLLIFLFIKKIASLSKESLLQINLILALSVFLLMMQLIFVEYLHIVFALKLNLMRGLYLMKILSIIILVAWIKEKLLAKKSFSLILFLVTFALILIYNEYLIGILFPSLIILIINNYSDILIRWFKYPLGIGYFFSFFAAILFFYLAPKGRFDIFQIVSLKDVIIILVSSVIITIILLHHQILKDKIKSYLFRIFIVIVCLVVVIHGYIFFTEKKYFPEVPDSQAFFELTKWVKSHISKDDLFLVIGSRKLPSRFRIFAERSNYYSEFDGIQSFFYRDFALEWVRRDKLIRQGEGNIVELIKQEGINYLVIHKDYQERISQYLGSLNLIFENDVFKVYIFKMKNK